MGKTRQMSEELYNELCQLITDFETSPTDDMEEDYLCDGEWLDVFYEFCVYMRDKLKRPGEDNDTLKDYRKEAEDYITENLEIEEDVVSGEINDIDHLAEILIDSIETDYRRKMTDEEFEKEAERERHEIYSLLHEKYEDIVKRGIKIREEREDA